MWLESLDIDRWLHGPPYYYYSKGSVTVRPLPSLHRHDCCRCPRRVEDLSVELTRCRLSGLPATLPVRLEGSEGCEIGGVFTKGVIRGEEENEKPKIGKCFVTSSRFSMVSRGPQPMMPSHGLPGLVVDRGSVMVTWALHREERELLANLHIPSDETIQVTVGNGSFRCESLLECSMEE